VESYQDAEMAHILQEIDLPFVALSDAAMLKEIIFQRLTERRMWCRTFSELLSQQPSTDPLFTIIIMERLQKDIFDVPDALWRTQI
jgi:hypothetical protein